MIIILRRREYSTRAWIWNITLYPRNNLVVWSRKLRKVVTFGSRQDRNIESIDIQKHEECFSKIKAFLTRIRLLEHTYIGQDPWRTRLQLTWRTTSSGCKRRCSPASRWILWDRTSVDAAPDKRTILLDHHPYRPGDEATKKRQKHVDWTSGCGDLTWGR